MREENIIPSKTPWNTMTPFSYLGMKNLKLFDSHSRYCYTIQWKSKGSKKKITQGHYGSSMLHIQFLKIEHQLNFFTDDVLRLNFSFFWNIRLSMENVSFLRHKNLYNGKERGL